MVRGKKTFHVVVAVFVVCERQRDVCVRERERERECV